MYPTIRPLFAAFALCLSAALASPAAADTADSVIGEARAECARLNNGTLTVADTAVARVDVDGDGAEDTIVNAAGFECSSSASYFCGSGGCKVTVLVGGARADVLARDWQLVEVWDQPVLLIAVHGAECGTAAKRCVKALVWEGGALRSPGS